MNSKVVLPFCYFPPIGWWVNALARPNVILDPFEFHIKQSYRSRCKIYSVHGPQVLTVVTDNNGSKTPMNKTTLVSYEPWRKVHFKALESAYKSSPYFEFFDKELESIISGDYNSLDELNWRTIEWVNSTLNLNINFKKATEFIIDYKCLDYRPGKRNEFIDTELLPKYNQVFSDKGLPFEPNLSILDLILNLGMEARPYLTQIVSKI
ncbi:MAG: WbqC family protein [Salibacteraceae bacterium]